MLDSVQRLKRLSVVQWLRSYRYPALEIRNRIVNVLAERRNVRFQRAEIERLRGQISRPSSDPRVLVVIPTFKRPTALREAVRTALSQTVDDVAVVVVDDGGGLGELPADPRLIAVSLSRNTATVGLVRNVAINLVESAFIAFLDDDNVWTPDHLATALAAFDDDPELGMVYTSVRRLWPDGSQLDVLDQPFDRRRLREGSFVDVNSMVVRRNRSDRGFSVLPRGKNTHPEEDWEYIWRLSRGVKVAHVPPVTVLYSINPDSYYTVWLDSDGQELRADSAGPSIAAEEP